MSAVLGLRGLFVAFAANAEELEAVGDIGVTLPSEQALERFHEAEIDAAKFPAFGANHVVMMFALVVMVLVAHRTLTQVAAAHEPHFLEG